MMTSQTTNQATSQHLLIMYTHMLDGVRNRGGGGSVLAVLKPIREVETPDFGYECVNFLQ
jgi:hypothetical protein